MMFDIGDNECHSWGAGGGSKVTKAYLSETFGCSIYEIARVILGVQWGGYVNESVSFRNVQMFDLCDSERKNGVQMTDFCFVSFRFRRKSEKLLFQRKKFQ